jgi:aminoglycoside/choline kinase family phosphotransferase
VKQEELMQKNDFPPPQDSSDKYAQLKDWVALQLKSLSEDAENSPEFDWLPLPGDAGFRHYFRVRLQSSSLMAVFSPPETENNKAFFKIDSYFREHGVHVPKVLARDFDYGFLLLEDLGEKLYLEYLNYDTVDVLYGEALMALLRIQQCPLDYATFPLYDEPQLRKELALFSEWFVPKILKYRLSDEENALIDNAFSVLVASACEQTKVTVHRDFHSRNLVYGAGGVPGIIDFQDAVIGPVTYDLVSLLKDCYISWPRENVQRWALAYANMAVDVGIMPPTSKDQFITWFDLMGLQRHIKVLGIFSRLSLRDGKHQYLNDLPQVLEYVRSVLARYPVLEAFGAWFEGKLMPEVNKQPWMKATSPR